ncbi:MAG: DUF2764 domain-containing protein [Bacteroidaceae bacterium]|nr:DUF2764 domain-containing protein [Bacteroidaceae bacterium]
MSKYYGLLTGLPDITLQGNKLVYTIKTLKEECEQSVTNADKRMLAYYFLHVDCMNLVRVLKSSNSQLLPNGNYTPEDISEIITLARESENNNSKYPAFMLDFVRSYDLMHETEGYIAEDQVSLLFYQYAMKCSNKFIADWFTLNFNISNVLTALLARKYGWSVGDYVLGNDEIADMLRISKAKDFDLGKEYAFIDDLMKIADENDPVMKEKKIDAFKWQWLDDRTFDDFFSINALFAYICKTDMLERWEHLDIEHGKATFTQIIENLRSSAEVPADFKVGGVMTK